MKHLLKKLLLCCALLCAPALQAAPTQQAFSFAVINQATSAEDSTLRESLRQASQRKAAFIVVNGIRPRTEPCSDAMYVRRQQLLAESGRAVIISLAARDWAECRNESGEPIAQERLHHLRELLFADDHVSRTKKLPLARQSSVAKFRNYPENALWESGRVLFATVNLPANNNHYLAAAGRNHEFEDRMVANRAWLQRIFSQAKRHKMRGIVLFADANPLALPLRTNRAERRDGFIEVRKQLGVLVARFPGKVLLVHGRPSVNGIAWRGNLGIVGAGREMLEFAIQPSSASLFSIVRVRK